MGKLAYTRKSRDQRVQIYKIQVQMLLVYRFNSAFLNVYTLLKAQLYIGGLYIFLIKRIFGQYLAVSDNEAYCMHSD